MNNDSVTLATSQQTTKQELRVFAYNNNSITFELTNGDVMVNLTQMAKPFGKRPYDFIVLDQTKEFIEVLKVRVTTGIPVVNIQNGGSNPGTWAHQKLALKFAAWLNPEFELWVYDRVEELLRHGATAINPSDLLNPDFIISLATELKKERAEKERLLETTVLQSKELKESAPKVEYYDQVLQAEGLVPITVIAKELGMSAVSLNKLLCQHKIIYKVGGVWVLSASFAREDYARTKTFTYSATDGDTKTAIHLYWTEKGRRFVHWFVNKGKDYVKP